VEVCPAQANAPRWLAISWPGPPSIHSAPVQLNRPSIRCRGLRGLTTGVDAYAETSSPPLAGTEGGYPVIQVLLGQKLETRRSYAQVATDLLREVVSPLETLQPCRPRSWCVPHSSGGYLPRPRTRLATSPADSLIWATESHVRHRIVCTRHWVGMCCIAPPVSMTKSPTTLAVTATARMPASAANAGSKPGRPISLPVDITCVSLASPDQRIAYTNKAVIYGLLFEVAAETYAPSP